MYYPLYTNPFYYPSGAYMSHMCSYGNMSNTYNTQISNNNENSSPDMAEHNNRTFSEDFSKSEKNSDLFSITEDRLEVFGICINIDDLIILIMLFFMFRENQIDYSIIIILALILFDQS